MGLDVTRERTVWTRAEVLTLASTKCGTCLGFGLTPGKGRNNFEQPCNCVLRTIFDACLARFRRATEEGSIQGRVLLGSNGAVEHSMVNEEYASDFLKVSKRTLCPDGQETLRYKIFKYHVLYGAESPLVQKRLGLTMTKKAFFDEVYRIKHILGRVFKELEPYALYPTDEYFSPGCKGRMNKRVEETMTWY